MINFILSMLMYVAGMVWIVYYVKYVKLVGFKSDLSSMLFHILALLILCFELFITWVLVYVFIIQ